MCPRGGSRVRRGGNEHAPCCAKLKKTGLRRIWLGLQRRSSADRRQIRPVRPSLVRGCISPATSRLIYRPSSLPRRPSDPGACVQRESNRRLSRHFFLFSCACNRLSVADGEEGTNFQDSWPRCGQRSSSYNGRGSIVSSGTAFERSRRRSDKVTSRSFDRRVPGLNHSGDARHHARAARALDIRVHYVGPSIRCQKNPLDERELERRVSRAWRRWPAFGVSRVSLGQTGKSPKINAFVANLLAASSSSRPAALHYERAARRRSQLTRRLRRCSDGCFQARARARARVQGP